MGERFRQIGLRRLRVNIQQKISKKFALFFYVYTRDGSDVIFFTSADADVYADVKF